MIGTLARVLGRQPDSVGHADRLAGLIDDPLEFAEDILMIEDEVKQGLPDDALSTVRDLIEAARRAGRQ